MTEKFCTDEHMPSGDWVKATMKLNVVGVSHRRASVLSFVNKAEYAELKKLKYGLELVAEPENPYDKYALKIYGYVEYRNLFGNKKAKRWHIGYVQREIAKQFYLEFIDNGLPISIVLYAIYSNPPYLDISYMLLAPPGNSHSARFRRHNKRHKG